MDWFLYDNGLRHERVKLAFISNYKPSNLFWFKDSLQKKIRFASDYTLVTATLIISKKMFRHFFLERGNFKFRKKTFTTSDDWLQYDCPIILDNFGILSSNFSNIKLLIMKRLLIKHDQPVLNDAIKPFSVKFLWPKN